MYTVSMMAAADRSLPQKSWEHSVLGQLSARDALQSRPFSKLATIHQQLLKTNQKLQTRIKKLESDLRDQQQGLSSPGGSAGGGDSEQTKRKLEALKAELSELYKRDSEGSRERLRLSSDNEQLLRENQRLKETAASASKSIAEARETESSLRNRLSTVEADCETLKDELDSLRKTLSREEEAAHALRRENDSLVARLVADKQRAAEELNRMNAQIEALKASVNQTGSKTAASSNAFQGAAGAGEDADGDATPSEAHITGGDDEDELWELVGAAEGAIPQNTKHVIDAHEQDINSVCFSESSAIVASASSDGTVALWDAVTAKRRGLLRGGDGSGAIMCAHVWGGVAAGGSSARVTYVWDLSTERVRLNITGHAGKVYAAQFVHGGRTLVTASTDRTVKLWDLTAGGQCVRTIDGKSIVNCMVVSSDGMSVVTGHQNSMVALWDARTGGKMAENRAQHSTAITDVRLSAASDQHAYVLTMSKDNTLSFLDARTLAPAEGGHRRSSSGGGVGGASPVHAGGARAPAAPDRMPARARGGSWGLGSMLSSLSSSLSGGGASGALPPTSTSAAAAAGASPHALHSTEQRGPAMRHQEFRVPFNWSDAALSPRAVLPAAVEAAAGQGGAGAAGGGLPHYIAAAGGADGKVYLWDVATKWQVGCLGKVHSKPVAAVAFSGDGRRLVTGDGAGRLAFWQ